jgi:hypothetical protein
MSLALVEYDMNQLCSELAKPRSTVRSWIDCVLEINPALEPCLSHRTKLYKAEMLDELKIISEHGITAYKDAYESVLITTNPESLLDGDFDTVHESIEVLELDTLTQTYTVEFQELAQKELEKAQIEQAKEQARSDFRTKLETYNAAKNVESAKQRIQAAKDAIDSNPFLKMIGIDSSFLPKVGK